MFELLALTYSEFDNHVGPQLMYQFPLDVVSKDDFENISEYVIVGKHLCGKAIAVRTEQFQYVNYSVAIDNPKYERNALLFAVGVVLSLDADMDVYKPLLRRLATTLIALEQEKEFLFQPSSKETLQVILQSAYEQLVHNRQAFLQFDESNLLIIELFQAPPPPTVINSYDVPVLLHDKIALIGLPWDITIQHLVHHINGENHVKGLSKVADMDLDCVMRSLQLLLYYGCCVITDVLHFTNVYVLNPVAFDLLETCDYIDLNKDALGVQEVGDGGVDVAALPVALQESYRLLVEIQLFCCASIEHPPSLVEICLVMVRFRSALSLREVIIACLGLSSTAVAADTDTDTVSVAGTGAGCTSSGSGEPPVGTGSSEAHSATGGTPSCLSRINVKRFIAIMLAKNVIRRVHEYPVYIPPESISEDSAGVLSADIVEPTRISGKGWNIDKEHFLLTGNQPLESLCCKFNVAYGDIVHNKPNVHIVYK